MSRYTGCLLTQGGTLFRLFGAQLCPKSEGACTMVEHGEEMTHESLSTMSIISSMKDNQYIDSTWDVMGLLPRAQPPKRASRIYWILPELEMHPEHQGVHLLRYGDACLVSS